MVANLYDAVAALQDPEGKLSCIPAGPERDELQSAFDVAKWAKENAHRATLNFGGALAALHEGFHVARAGWNGRGMDLVLVDGGDWSVAGNVIEYEGVGGRTMSPWIGLRTADGSFVPWTASQTDLLATDWQVVA